MKAFFLRHRKLHLGLLAELVLYGVFCLVSRIPSAASQAAAGARRVRLALAALSYRVSFSVMELLCGLVVLLAAAYLLGTAVAVLRRPDKRGRRLYSAALGALCIAGGIYLGFCWLWGICYTQPSFQDQSGIRAEAVSTRKLEAVTEYFADQLARTAPQVERDADGGFSVSVSAILAHCTQVYGPLTEQYPFLAFEDPGVKTVHFSRLMSRLDFTGVYCPFTGESNVNVDAPACLLPSTAAHELAHQRGFASEQECNFISILACTRSGFAEYAYSGWLLGYIHLANALYQADRAAWQRITEALPDSVRTDLWTNNAYWAQFQESGIKKASNAVYDRFLKSYGVEEGMRSYGMVVDLLVAYPWA